MSPCDQRPSAVGWAFSALEPDDEARVLEHLPHCADCRRAVREAREVAAALAAAVPTLDPPPELRERVLAIARAEAASDPAPVRAPAPAGRAMGSNGNGNGHGPATPLRREPAPSARPPRSRRSVGLILVAAAALGVGLLSARAVLPTETPPPATVTAADRAQRIVDGAEARDPGSPHATLRSGDGSPVAVVLSDGTGPRVVPLALPATGPDRSFVLWATGGADPVAVATVASADGITRPVAGAEAGDVRGYAVSVEPTGPVPTRPSNVVATGLVA